MKKNLSIRSGLNIRKTTAIFTGFLVLLLVIGSSIAMADTGFSENGKASAPVSAPKNSDFAKYQQNKDSNQPEPSLDGHKAGFIPPTVDLSHLKGTQSINVPFPAYYDLRTLNKVTSVKDQGSAGTCWAFATYGALESYLMPGSNRDFSENNLKNLLSSGYPEGFDRNADEGANHIMSTAYLARWSGPVDEKDDPYDPDSDVSPLNPSIQKHVQNMIILPDRQGSLDNDGIKSAVQNYGAVYTTIYYNDTCYSPTANSYYYTGASVINHAVAIVGWDDSYDKNKFTQVPPGNGAFIVKNSWGSGWGEDGYFYVSYYDSKIGSYNSIFTAENTNNYKNIYQYDPLGWTGACGYNNPTCWCANIFTAKSDDTLKAVSFYTTDSNCNYEIYVYTNVSSSPISQTGPVASKSGTSSFAGYHTVPLDSAVQLKAGQKFSIVVKFTTSGYGYPAAMERPYTDYSSKATANAGESFISSGGETWNDITQYFTNTNLCIKAFTDSSGSVPPIANFSAKPTSGTAPLNVSFTDSSTRTPTAWKWSFGDGTNSTQQNPTHTYSKAGNYTVVLTASNSAGSNKMTKPSYIKVTAVTKPVANFTSNVTSGTAPLYVAFTDKSKGTPTAWKWSFGDGINSTQQNPTHKYSKAGNYTVVFTASNSAGSSKITKSGYIKVITKPVANFTSNVTSGYAPLNVAFTDKSKGTPTAWKWSFGDGINSTIQNPTHKYSKAGNYTVVLTASNSAGSNKITKSGYIKVVKS